MLHPTVGVVVRTAHASAETDRPSVCPIAFSRRTIAEIGADITAHSRLPPSEEPHRLKVASKPLPATPNVVVTDKFGEDFPAFYDGARKFKIAGRELTNVQLASDGTTTAVEPDRVRQLLADSELSTTEARAGDVIPARETRLRRLR